MTSAAPTAVTTCSFGTRRTTYHPIALDPLGPSTGNFDLHHCLCFQNEFEHFSPEELRLADYETGPVIAGTPSSDPALPRRVPARASGPLTVTDGTNHEGSDMSTDSFDQTREDGSQLLLAEADRTPQVRLPPLNGFDEFTIRRLYSPVVADMARIHPKLVGWIGATAIAMIESMATKEGIFDEDIEKQVAELKLEVMKAKLYAARAKQLQQETLEELNTIKRERDSMPHTPSATSVELVINAAHPSLTSPLLENTSTSFAERYSTNASKTHPYDSSRKTNPIAAVNAATLHPSSASAGLPARPETSASRFSAPSSHRDGPFAPNPEAQTDRNCGSPKFSFGSGPLTFSSQPNSLLFPFPNYTGELGQALMPKPAQNVSPHIPLHPSTTFTETTNRDTPFSAAPGHSAFTESLSNSSLIPGHSIHDSVRGRDNFANPSHRNVYPNPAPTSNPSEPAQRFSRRKRVLDDRPRNDSYRYPKKARND
jgi:hypothetical protein